MTSRHSRTILQTLLCVLAFLHTSSPAPAFSAAQIVWWPYLQQLSDRSVVIRWTTQEGSVPEVRFQANGGIEQRAGGTSRPVLQLNTVLHRVALENLQPDTIYSYRIFVDGAELLAGENLTFRTAPPTGSDATFRFIAFGDYGQATESQKLLRDQMLRDSFRFTVTAGDHAYEDGAYADYDAKVFPIYSNVWSRTPMFPAIGDNDRHAENGAAYYDLFELPRQALRESEQGRYYSFDYGSAHIVIIDSTDPLNINDRDATDDMLDWLRADLARTTQRWKIAVTHNPAFSKSVHSSDERVQDKLIPIFLKYNVALVISGDDHNWQRSKPMYYKDVTTVDRGVTYLVSGTGSQANYACSSAYWTAAKVCAENFSMYARITVAPDCLSIEGVRDTGAVIDNAQICRFANANPTATITPTPSVTSAPGPSPTSTPPGSTPTPQVKPLPPRVWLPFS